MLIKTIVGRPPEIPFGYGVCWQYDYGQRIVVAPLGLHWLLRGAHYIYLQIEYKLPQRLEPELGYPYMFAPWPLMRWVPEYNIAQRPGHGLCWAQYEPYGDQYGDLLDEPNGAPHGSAAFGRYTAPIGLNLVYALARRLIYPK